MSADAKTEWKYSDCPTTEASVEIDASRDAVWQMVSDIGMPLQFSSEVQATEWLDGHTEAALGRRFAGRNRHAAIGDWEVVCTVTRFEPLQCFEWVVGEPDEPAAVWRFVLTDTATENTTESTTGTSDTVTLRQEMQMGPARSGLSFAIDAMPDKESKIIARRLDEHRANMQANLDGVKAAVEGTTHGATS